MDGKGVVVALRVPDVLPEDIAALDDLGRQAGLELAVFRARMAAREVFTAADVDRVKSLVAARGRIDEARSAEAARLAQVAHHEAGHAVVAALLGGQVAAVEVYPGGVTDDAGRGGYCTQVPASPMIEHGQHLFMAAGAASEAMHLYGRRATAAHADALLTGQDAEFLRGWVLTASVSAARPTGAVMPLLRRCWPAVEVLAARLVAGEEVRHKHVLAALGVRYDDAAPFALANIRAGLRAVPGGKAA